MVRAYPPTAMRNEGQLAGREDAWRRRLRRNAGSLGVRSADLALRPSGCKVSAHCLLTKAGSHIFWKNP